MLGCCLVRLPAYEANGSKKKEWYPITFLKASSNVQYIKSISNDPHDHFSQLSYRVLILKTEGLNAGSLAIGDAQVVSQPASSNLTTLALEAAAEVPQQAQTDTDVTVEEPAEDSIELADRNVQGTPSFSWP